MRFRVVATTSPSPFGGGASKTRTSTARAVLVEIGKANGEDESALTLHGYARCRLGGIWSGELAAAAYPSVAAADSALGEATFARVPIDPPVTLSDGMDYSVEIATAAGSAYAIPGLRDGSDGYGFSAASTFSDGHAEVREGGGAWAGWTIWSSADTDVQDLDFYFVVAR